MDSSKAVRCPSCQHANPTSANFCQKCGALILQAYQYHASPDHAVNIPVKPKEKRPLPARFVWLSAAAWVLLIGSQVCLILQSTVWFRESLWLLDAVGVYGTLGMLALAIGLAIQEEPFARVNGIAVLCAWAFARLAFLFLALILPMIWEYLLYLRYR